MMTMIGVTCAGVRAKTTALIRVTGAYRVVATTADLLDADVAR